MKLSYLESLVKAMRAHADRNGNEDPNVEFYDDNRAAITEALASGSPFLNMEVVPDITDSGIHQFAMVSDGSAARRGDFAIPVKPC